MKIQTIASRFFADQISRIDRGILELSHELLQESNKDETPDLIFCNDAEHYDQAINIYNHFNQSPKLILNVLDCPDFLPEWDTLKQKWISQLSLADKVTAISKFTQSKIKEYFNINAEVIYNPIKPVSYIPEVKKDILAIFVGRCNASNKRVREILLPLYQNLTRYFGSNCMHFVGSENSGFGVNHYIVSDGELNMLYNRSVFGMISSSQEGLNLPLIEMTQTNVLPIIAEDMSTSTEFGIPELLCEPTPQAFFYKIKEVSENLPKYSNILNQYGDRYSQQFSGIQIARNIMSVYNSI